MKVLYSILCFPAWIAFCIYSRKNHLIIEDFDRWRDSFRRLGACSRYTAFRLMMSSYPEYRYQFYYRLPFVIRHLLNIILRRCNNLYIDMPSVAVGGV